MRDTVCGRRLVAVALLGAALWLSPPASAAEGSVAAVERIGTPGDTAGTTTVRQQPGSRSALEHDRPHLRSMPLLASDEPNMLGWTRDNYEKQGFMDFTLSMRYPLLFEALDEGYKFDMLPFISFTGRMGQYFDRHSSPVVTKRFNPKLFFRFYEAPHSPDQRLWSDDNGLDYFDIGYAHESDGQSVDSPTLFAAAVASYGSAAIAQDYVSRGWDYLAYKRHLLMHGRFGLASLDADVRYFLPRGLLQGSIEEYGAWEGPRTITHISQVDGLRLKLNFGFRRDWFKGASLLIMTGYRDPGRHSTVRAELGFTPLSDFMGVPVVLWGQSGYRANLAQYYRRTWSVGISASFETFN